MNKVTELYSIKQISEMLDEGRTAVRWRLNHKGFKGLTFYQGRKKSVLFSQSEVDAIIIVKTNLYQGLTTVAANDLQPPIYKQGDKVNFYQGRNKFIGTVKLALKGDSYRVDSSEIGVIDLRWFEMGYC
jgi:hypothetical protein